MPTTASENRFPLLRFVEGAAPSTPPSGEVHLYAKSDGLLYWKDDAGTEYPVSAGVALSAHLADTTDAHDASAISADPTGYGNSSATDVQGILDDFDGAISAAGGGSPTFCGCKVYNAGTQAVTASTIALVAFGAEEYDTDGIHDTGSNTSRLTVPSGKAGKWLLEGGFFVDNPNSVDAQCGFRLNGSTLIRGTGVVQQTAFVVASAHAIVDLDVADYVELYFYTSSSGRTIGHASSPDAQAWAAATFLGA